MTKKEKLIILKACELLECENITFSCVAIDVNDNFNKLVYRYQQFFKKHRGKWFDATFYYKHERIMCLLMFMQGEKYL